VQNARQTLVGLGLLLVAGAAALVLRLGHVETAEVGEVDPLLADVAAAFRAHREATGSWPCRWSGRSSSATRLESFECLADRGLGGTVVDRWGNPLRVVYQAPTPRLIGASRGVISLVSLGPDGALETQDSRAVEGRAAGDDRLELVTRDAR
jgi:hypothetical protein